MAETNPISTPPAAIAGAASAAAATEKKKRTFKIVLPEPPKPAPGEPPAQRYSGLHPIGLHFRDGVATTDDAIKAHSCQEYGWDVLDAETNKPAWPKEKAPAKK